MSDSSTDQEPLSPPGSRSAPDRSYRAGLGVFSFIGDRGKILLRRFGTRLAASLYQSAAYARSNMRIFAVLEIIGQPLYYFLWQYVYPQPCESLSLRLICIVFALPMLFEKQMSRLPRIGDTWVAIYWLFCLFFELPFFFFLMTFLNHLNAVWAMSSLAALMLLVILVFDWLMTILLAVAGVGLAWLAFIGWQDSLVIHSRVPLPVLVFTDLFGLLVGCAVNYKAEMLAREKLAAITDAVGTMAHELRTPLLGIRSGAQGLNRYLPAIMEGYRLARDHGLAVEPIRSAHFHQMHSVLERIHGESEYMGAVLDMLLVNSNRAAIDRTIFESVSIDVCIQEALDRYPFHSARERERVHWQPGVNFSFRGSRLLMVHVLFNLLKNALYQLASSDGGGISIWTGRNAKGMNTVYFRDNGPGIRPEVLPRIFNRFYSGMPRGQGTGIGLAFVQLVIDSFDGHIRCRSVLGEYTEFVISFPEVDGDARY